MANTRKPNLVVYGRPLGGGEKFWKRIGAGWTNNQKGVKKNINIKLDFYPTTGELQVWPADADGGPEEHPQEDDVEKLRAALKEALQGWNKFVPWGDITDTPQLDDDRRAIARLAKLTEES